MFFAKMRKFRRTLAVRLTLTYALVFSIASLIAFSILYMVVKSNADDRTDSLLRDQARECASILSSKGLDAIKSEFENFSEAMGTHDVFLKLVDPDGREIASSDKSAWKHVTTDASIIKAISSGNESFQTLTIPGHHIHVRAMYMRMPDKNVLQIVQSLKDNERMLESFRVVFATAMAVVTVFAMIFGWLIAKRTLSKVEEVTQTATRISEGALDQRVPLRGDGDEIDQLAKTLNGMLDRIQTLIKEMRETNDNIAHDLRSPLTRLRGMAEMTLTSHRTIDVYENMVADTIEECDRLLAMINTILDIAEAEGGVIKISREKCDVAKLVRDACELFQPLAEDHKVTICVNAPEKCEAALDVSKLQRALSNLLDNAIKFNRSGGQVTVMLASDGTRVNLSVEDTGSGIASRDLPQIFERFYRSDRSRSKTGNGLGLSLARALVRVQGGDIQVRSTPNVGSAFSISIPAL